MGAARLLADECTAEIGIGEKVGVGRIGTSGCFKQLYRISGGYSKNADRAHLFLGHYFGSGYWNGKQTAHNNGEVGGILAAVDEELRLRLVPQYNWTDP